MICKFCNSELEDGSMVCPVCGSTLTEEPELIVDALADAFQEEAFSREMPEMEALFDIGGNEQPDLQREPEKKGKTKHKLWAYLLAAVAVMAIGIAVFLHFYIGFGFDFGNRENDIWYRDSYTFKDMAARLRADEVVATVGDFVLTNNELQVHYWMQVYDYYSYYGDGYFDISKPLDKQWYSKSDNLTWEQYFIDAAINSWHRNVVLYLLAQENDSSADYNKIRQTVSNSYMENLEKMASQYGYESADALIKADMGIGASADGYIKFMALYSIGVSYYSDVYETIELTMEQIEEYFAEHQAEYAKKGITKDSGKLVDVRHILLQPEGGTEDVNGDMIYTQEAWDACYVKAEALLAQWQNGEATEASFGELANANSADPGSNTHGGLYTGVANGYMVEEFNDWIFDESRETGNTGIVKTKHGYHIMYFVNSEDAWIVNTREDCIVDQINEMIVQAYKRWPIDVNYKKIVLSEMSFG